MATHPYISGPGSITQMISFLRKSFPATVNGDTVKKFGLAPNNESYVINALQFLGLIDEAGKRTERGHAVLTTHDEDAFRKAFAELITEAYEDLFELRGDDAWTMNRSELIGYFRTTDKTSEVIGTRQARVFQALRVLAGREEGELPKIKVASAGKAKAATTAKSTKSNETSNKSTGAKIGLGQGANGTGRDKKVFALTVRIEINLPAEGTQDTYDNIFKSIKANLIDG